MHLSLKRRIIILLIILNNCTILSPRLCIIIQRHCKNGCMIFQLCSTWTSRSGNVIPIMSQSEESKFNTESNFQRSPHASSYKGCAVSEAVLYVIFKISVGPCPRAIADDIICVCVRINVCVGGTYGFQFKVS